MGKNYRKELNMLPEIFIKAKEADCNEIIRFLKMYKNETFIGIGSGGSFSVAKIFEYFCTVSGYMGKSITPLELGYYNKQLRKNAAVLFTAGGSNNDSRNTYKYLADHEPKGLLTCCMKANSPVEKMQRENLHNYFLGYQMPVAKDGYLAVESIISALVILANAFSEATHFDFFNLPVGSEWLECCIEVPILEQVLLKESIIVLHGGITTPAAIDLESKFSEASLGNVQLADFRNFSHGRHFWLCDRENSTGIIALIGEEQKKLAMDTLEMVPNMIPVLKIMCSDKTIIGMLEAFNYIFEIVGYAGKMRGIDPGRPKVPEFGKKMYHINYNINAKKNSIYQYAAERKIAAGFNVDLQECIVQARKNESYLKKKIFKGIVFDYDGTLHNKEKHTDIEDKIFLCINKLLGANIKIGVATGRGKSVRNELQKVINPLYWHQVVIAYYNGGCLGTLDDNSQPNKKGCKVPNEFLEIRDFIEQNLLNEVVNVEGIVDKNPYQLTVIEEKDSAYFETVKNYARAMSGIKLLYSSHSLDIIPITTSKNNIFLWKEWRNICQTEFLRIGDSGQYGGNDFELLQSEYGISVDYVSAAPNNCWNYAKPGMRNLEATLYYLSEVIKVVEDGITWGV